MTNLFVHFAKKAVPARVKFLSKARRRDGQWFLDTADRRALEQKIIPHFASLDDVHRVLDVGCDWYTAGYPKLFSGQDYTSIDIDPAQARFAIAAHKTASLLELDDHFDEGSFDLVVANGVFGWGVNGQQPIATAMDQIRRVLRPGGYLVVGWNDVAGRQPEPLGEITDAAEFEPLEISTLGGSSLDTDTAHRHLFRFFKRCG